VRRAAKRKTLYVIAGWPSTTSYPGVTGQLTMPCSTFALGKQHPNPVCNSATLSRFIMPTLIRRIAPSRNPGGARQETPELIPLHAISLASHAERAEAGGINEISPSRHRIKLRSYPFVLQIYWRML
jgi:hypothetical protein